jgi:hypothetical protein
MIRRSQRDGDCSEKDRPNFLSGEFDAVPKKVLCGRVTIAVLPRIERRYYSDRNACFAKLWGQS